VVIKLDQLISAVSGIG